MTITDEPPLSVLPDCDLSKVLNSVLGGTQEGAKTTEPVEETPAFAVGGFNSYI